MGDYPRDWPEELSVAPQRPARKANAARRSPTIDVLELGAGKPGGRKRKRQTDGEEHQPERYRGSHRREAVRPRRMGAVSACL